MVSQVSRTAAANGVAKGFKVVLASRPKGQFQTSDLAVVEQNIVDADGLQDGEVLVENSLLSIDAFIRTTLDESAFHGAAQLDSTIMAIGHGTVIASKSKKFKPGTKVAGAVGAQSVGPVSDTNIMARLSIPGVPESASLGILGLTTGMTAWVGINAVLKPPRRGEIVVVSAAAGAVGSCAAQFARNRGAKVIGIAGGASKCSFLTDDLNLYGAVDYKSKECSVGAQLDALAPDGIDFFMDQVGGDTLDAVLNRLKPGARVVVCGAMSQYEGNLGAGQVQGPRSYLKLAERNATMKGFTVMAYLYLLPWMLVRILISYWRGHLVMRETFMGGGIHGFPAALSTLLNGGHTGKMLLKL